MAVSIGRVQEEVVFDGHGNIAQARAIGEEAGAASGDGYDKKWSSKLDDIAKKTKVRFGKSGNESGNEFTKGLDKNMDTRATNKLGRALDDLGSAFKRNRVQVQNHGGSLARWQLIIAAVSALILGAGNDIAVLGSAIGAGTVVLGSAIVSLGIAGLVAYSIFKDLNTSLKKLPPSMQGVAKQFEALKASFKGLRDELSIAFVKNIGSGFGDVAKILAAITPNLDEMAVALAQVFKATATGLSPGTRAFTNLQKVIHNAVVEFKGIAQVAGDFAQGLLQAFGSARLAQSVGKLLGWLDTIAKAFDKFAQSKAFNHWLDNADSVFGHVGGLIGSLAKVLDHLSTDKAVGSLNRLLDSVSRFLPVAGQLIDIGGKLDPLGLLAQILDTIGAAIQPIIKPMGDLATALNRVVSIAVAEWGKDLHAVFEGVAPLIQGVADAFAKMDAKQIKDIADAVFAAAAAFLVFKGAKGILGLSGKVSTLSGSMDELSTRAIALKASAGGVAGVIAGVVTAFSGGGPGGSAAGGALVGAQVGGLPGLLIGALAGAIASMFTDWPKWQNGLQQIADFFNQWWSSIANGAFSRGWDQIVAGFANGWQQIMGAFANGWAQLTGAFASGWGQIVGGFANGWSQIIGGFANGWAQIEGGIGTAWATITGAFANGWGQITGGVSTAWTTIEGSFANGWSQITGGVSTAWTTIQSSFSNGWSQITSATSTGANNITNSFKHGADQWAAAVSHGWSQISDAFANGWSQISGAVGTVIGNVISAFENGWQQIQDFVNGNPVHGQIIWSNVVPPPPSGGGGSGRVLQVTAAGGVFAGAQERLIAEAGPEAVVPLRRDLSRVDPSVRLLSAFAQGKLGKQQDALPTKQVIVEAGAVQVVYTGVDPEIVGTSAIDRLVARFA